VKLNVVEIKGQASRIRIGRRNPCESSDYVGKILSSKINDEFLPRSSEPYSNTLRKFQAVAIGLVDTSDLKLDGAFSIRSCPKGETGVAREIEPLVFKD